MPTLAIAATGSELRFAAQLVPEVTGISDVGGTATIVDVSAHDTSGNWGASIPTFLSGGTVRVTMNYVPGNAVHQSFWTAFLARTSTPCVVTLPDVGGATYTFNAYVTRHRVPTMPVNGVLPLEIELTVDGAVAFAA